MAELAIVIDRRDSIAVAVAELEEGQRCPVRVDKAVEEVEIKEKIPFGHKFAITGNSASYRKMLDNIDINTGMVVDGEKTLRQAGEEIFQELLSVADGKRTKV